MARTAESDTPVSMVVGGDEFVNEQRFHELRDRVRQSLPRAEVIELDAAQISRYGLDEALSPSLLSDTSIVLLANLQNADDGLVQALVSYSKPLPKRHSEVSQVICRHAGGAKGKKIIGQLTRAGAHIELIPELKKPEEKLGFVNEQFHRLQRRIDPAAAQRLVSVLGNATGELAAMCAQLCSDFDEDPISLNRVDQYLTANPQTNAFVVANLAAEGKTDQAVIAMRTCLEQGTVPIALIGSLATELRTMAKASAVRSGTITQAEAKANPWALKNAMRRLSGWTSEGMAACMQMLAWADEQCKTTGGDPAYAVERSVEFISQKGHSGMIKGDDGDRE